MSNWKHDIYGKAPQKSSVQYYDTLKELGIKSDGGPSSYYDFKEGWTTLNDMMEYKAIHQWGAYSLHLKDLGKAIFRFGVKVGTAPAYDARKIIYSGLRLLGMIEGKNAIRQELLKLLDDNQFGGEEK